MISVPEGWEPKQLIDVVDKNDRYSFTGGPFGSDLKSSDYTDEGVRVIQLQNIGDGEFKNNDFVYTSEEKAEELKSCQIYPDEIIMSKMGDPVGRACLIPNIEAKYVMCSDGIRIAVDRKRFDNKFIYYSVNNDSFRRSVERVALGSTRKRVGLTELKILKLVVPDLPEQQKIAEILSGIDRVIEATQTLIDKEKMIKKGLMADLLHHGIDEQGLIRTPQTHRYIESSLGMIPEGWRFLTLADIGHIVTGNTPSTDIKEYYLGNIPFIGPVDFRGTKYIKDSEKKVSELGLLQSRKILKDSIMTVCIGSTIGKIAIAAKDCCTNQQINSLTCKNEFDAEYVFYAMDKFLQKQLDIEAGLQAVPIVNKSSFSTLKLPIPSLSEQQKIVHILSAQDRKIESKEANLVKLKHLKKALMADLLSGKVRVKV